MWIPTYDVEGQRTGKVNTHQIVTVFVEEHNKPSMRFDEPEKTWWEVHADTRAASMSSVRITPHKYTSHQAAIDHIDELDWNEPHRYE